jgi:hypothetical protein
MICDEVHERLDALVDGELGWWERWAVRRHVAGCGECSLALRETERLTELMRGRPRRRAPAELWGRLALALEAEGGSLARAGVSADSGRGRIPPTIHRLFPVTRRAFVTAASLSLAALANTGRDGTAPLGPRDGAEDHKPRRVGLRPGGAGELLLPGAFDVHPYGGPGG